MDDNLPACGDADDNQQRAIKCTMRLVVLLGLWTWVFFPEVIRIFIRSFWVSESAHAVAVPPAIACLILLRRAEIRAGLSDGSRWGVILIILGLLLHVATVWPFNYGYPNDLSTIPVIAGIVLVSCGWRILKMSLPMLLLLALSIPIGHRIYANLVIKPETATIDAAASVLDLLPVLDVTVRGTDLSFQNPHKLGIVALGESNRAARLALASAAIGIFVIFSRPRPWGRILVGLLAVAPLVMLCNLIRFLIWALMSVYVIASADSVLPRYVSGICSLFIAYAFFVFLCSVHLPRIRFFVRSREPAEVRRDGL